MRSGLVGRMMGFACLLLAGATHAATYSVYIDSDNDALTGCTVSTAAGNAGGVDWRLSASGNDEPPAINTLTLAECTGGSFPLGVSVGGAYPIGIDRIAGATDIVELAFPRELITGDVATDWNLFFVAESSLLGAVDAAGPVLVPTLGRPLLPDPVPQPAVIPGTTTWGLVLLAMAVGLLTVWVARRHPGMLIWVVVIGGSSMLGIAWAANYLLDGEIGDWDVPAVVTDASGDPTADEPQVDVLAGFAVRAGNQIFFRMDVRETRLPVVLQPRLVSALATPENTANGSVIGSLRDSTTGLAGLLTFSLQSQAPSSGFAVASNGDVSVVDSAQLDFETRPSFTLQTQIGLTGVPALSIAHPVTVTLSDINEAPTVNDQAFSVFENDANGTVLGTVIATDADAGAAGQVSYAVSGGSGQAAFSVNASTGQVTVSNAAAFNLGGSPYTLNLTVTDGGAPGLSDTAVITINVQDVNNAPSFTPGPAVVVNEDNAYAAIWATAIDDGDPAAQTLTFEISGNSNPALFQIAPALAADGTLSFTPAADANGSASMSIVLRDNGGTANGGADISAAQTLSITVTAQNDAPVVDLNGPAAGSGFAASFTEGAGEVAIVDAAALSVVDIDSTQLQRADAVMASVPDGAQESLLADTSGTSLVATYTPGSGTLSIVGNAPLADYQTVLRRLRYDNTSTNPTTTARNVLVNAVDLEGAMSAPVTSVVSVAAVNTPPSFTAGGNVTVLEDASAVNQVWATAISDGDGGGQTLNFEIVSNSNAALFSGAPSINATTGNLSFTPAADANGSATVVVQLRDNGGGSDVSPTANFDITITPVNDAPSANVPANAPGALENSGAQTVAGFVAAIATGPADEVGQTLTSTTSVQSTTGTLGFLVAPSIDVATGTLSYTPATDTSGSAVVRFVLQDNGGTANGGVNASVDYDFTLTIGGVNSAPVFTPGAATVTVNEDNGAYAAAWASGISDGDADEVQTVNFVVLSNSNAALFSSAPAIASDGQLSFTPAANVSGVATLSIALRDNGGTANGGDDESDPVALQINVQSVNDAPSFTIPATAPTVLENAGAQAVSGFATGMSAGPADESTQTLNFIENVTATTGSLTFAAPPSLDPLTGTLTYTPTDNTSGTATVSVVLADDGGTANGGVDTSAAQVFTIEVEFVNDPPTFVGGGNVTVNEDAAPYNTVWATVIDDGDSGVTQGLNFLVQSNDNPSLFSVAPSINSVTGNLNFSLAANANGIANLSVVLQDDGTGSNTSALVNFSISVTAVNDPPVVTPPTNVAVTRHIGRSFAAASADGLLANVTDSADGAGGAPFAVTAQTAAATTNAGRVTVASDGAWSYEPPAGSTTADSFDYEVCDSGVPLPAACTTVTATIELSGNIVWFVDDSAAAGGNGTLAKPFQTIAEAVAVAGTGGRIFVASGNYSGSITLLAGQQLIGQGVSVASGTSFDTVFGISPPSSSAARPVIGGTRPILTTAAGDAITLGTDGTIRGIEIGNTAGVGIAGANFGTLTLGDNVISGAGQALSLSTGTLAQASGANAFDSITSTSGSNNILLSAVGGSANFGNGALSGATNTAFQFSTGTATLSYAGSISKTTAGRLIDIDGAGTANLTLSGDLACSASCGSGAGNQGIRINGRSGGTYTVSGANKTFTGTSTNPALQFTSNTGATIALSAATTLGTTGNALAGTAISATGGGTLTLNGTLDITTAGGRAMVISGMTLGGTTSGSIVTNGALGAGVTVIDIQSSATSGTFVLGSELVLDHDDVGESGGGINLVNNTGTWSFPNVPRISTTGVTALRANNAGTLTFGETVRGQLVAFGVPALDVQNTTIGAAGLNAERIDAGTSGIGIVLNNTGASAGLTVTGTGTTAGSGGTIQNGSTGISLTNTRNVSLSNMQLNGFSDYAIRGSGVVGFSLTRTTVSGINGDDAGADEGSIRFTELTGAASITGCNISGAVEHNMQVVNTSGALGLTVTGTTFGSMNATTGSDGLMIETQGTAVINATVSNNTFTYAIGDHFQFSANSSTTNDVVFSNNVLSNAGPAVGGGGGVRLIGGSNAGPINASLSYDVLNNTIRDSRGTAIAVNKLGGSGVFAGVIQGNTVGVPGTVNSGSSEGSAYFQIHDNAGEHNSAVRSNVAYQYANYGIYLQAGGSGTVGSGIFHNTITGNTVANPGTAVFPKNGVHLNAGSTPGDTYALCTDVGGVGVLSNTLTGSGTDGGQSLRLRQRQSTTVRLPGYGGGASDTAAVVAFEQARNNVTDASAAVASPPGGGFVGGAACTQP